MRPTVRAQIELTPEMLEVLDDLYGVKKRRSDAVVARSRVHGLEPATIREKP